MTELALISIGVGIGIALTAAFGFWMHEDSPLDGRYM